MKANTHVYFVLVFGLFFKAMRFAKYVSFTVSILTNCEVSDPDVFMNI